MSSLHIVASSTSDVLARAVALALPGDALLLIENGVYAVADTKPNHQLLAALPAGVARYVLSEDLAARAIPVCLPEFKPVDYAGFVELVCHHHNSISWS